jgi:NAD-dependent deacetylase
VIEIRGEFRLPDELKSTLETKKAIVALTGAGISVESGIPDFRSPGGLWEIFDPAIYASIDTFLIDPERSWELFRAVGETVKGKEPNEAHRSLSRLEASGHLKAVITQNIDGLHQKAGSKEVIEVHGDHGRLECIRCGSLYPVDDAHFESEGIPACERCSYPLKPNVVLFGEAVRHLDATFDVLQSCDSLFVVGTSAQVYPVASFPYAVKERGGLVVVFDLIETPLTHSVADYFFKGKASRSLSVVEKLLTGE